MATYYFHLRDHRDCLLDQEGRELEGHETIVAAALCEARSMISAEAQAGMIDLDQAIEVEDERGIVVHRLDFRNAVTIKR